MVLLEVMQVEKYHSYWVRDEKHHKNYKLQFQFYGIDDLKVGDTVVIDESLLDTSSENFVQPYAFEIVKTAQDNIENSEYIAVKTQKSKFVLKRVYG